MIGFFFNWIKKFNCKLDGINFVKTSKLFIKHTFKQCNTGKSKSTTIHMVRHEYEQQKKKKVHEHKKKPSLPYLFLLDVKVKDKTGFNWFIGNKKKKKWNDKKIEMLFYFYINFDGGLDYPKTTITFTVTFFFLFFVSLSLQRVFSATAKKPINVNTNTQKICSK